MEIPYRIGIGHDTHRTALGGSMRLGGIDIDCGWHLIGHSDADVLLHAITDALLGAAGLEDIGQLFPDTAKENRGRDSAEMLQVAKDAMTSAGYRIANIDCVIRAERPKIAPIKRSIVDRVASILGISSTQVNLKGKTGESVGAVGRGEAIEAICVALLVRQS